MNYILIVLIAGNLYFTRITDTEKSCEKMGEFYTQGIEYTAEYICLSSKEVKEIMEDSE